MSAKTMKNVMALGAGGALIAGAIATASPSRAMPVLSHTAVVKTAASNPVTDVHDYRRGYYRHRYYGRGYYGHGYYGRRYYGGGYGYPYYGGYYRRGYGYPYWGNPYAYAYAYSYPYYYPYYYTYPLYGWGGLGGWGW